MKIWDMRKSNTLTHNHNYLMETITFEVHPITPTSSRNTLATILKAFCFFLILFFFTYFSFKHSMYGHIRDKRNTQLCKPKHHNFAMSKHTDILWLMSFSGEMIIHVFLLGFFSPFHQKEWFKIWKIRDQPNHTNHIKGPQSSHYLVVHEDAHLS